MSQAIASDYETAPPHKVCVGDNAYPQRLHDVLGEKAPPFLYTQGNMELLELPSIGFSGARKTSDAGLAMAALCAEHAAQNGVVVVSGHAAGVDLEAHYTALKTGGKTILVLPEGIRHFRARKKLKEVWNWDNVLVISQFSPDAIWRAHQAMARNKLMIALSRTMIVVEAGAEGGTMNAGQEMLKQKLRFFVADYENLPPEAKGNEILISKGATRLTTENHTNPDFFEQVLQLINEDAFANDATPRQEDMAF